MKRDVGNIREKQRWIVRKKVYLSNKILAVLLIAITVEDHTKLFLFSKGSQNLPLFNVESFSSQTRAPQNNVVFLCIDQEVEIKLRLPLKTNIEEFALRSLTH